MQTLTKTLTGAQLIIQTLKCLGVDSIFGYPGSVVLNLYNELSKQSNIKHILTRHEQAACHAADGYARATGKCGVVLVTAGPGATNIVTGLANAYLDCSPVIAITGQVLSKKLNKEAFQKVNIIDITKSCTKKNFQVTDINELQKTIFEAHRIAMTGKKGPVLIDITKDVLSSTITSTTENIILNYEQCNSVNIQGAVDLLNNSAKPVIISGGGAPTKAVKAISEKLNIPIVRTMMGYVDSDNYIGMVGIYGDKKANKILKESDLIFAIGTRLNDRVTSCFKSEDFCNKLLYLDIKPSNIPAKVKIVGDAEIILDKISEQVKQSDNKIWLEYAKNVESYVYARRSNLLHSIDVINEIQKYKQDMTVTTEVGQHQILAAKILKFSSKNKFITSGGLGTMGFGFPAAIGASIAQNGSKVICIAGDGSFQMNMQELATCMQYKLPIKVFILNNGYLGMVRQIQENNFDENYFATKLTNPDFVKLAQSYGALGIRVEKMADLKPAIEKAFSSDLPAIIDCIVEPMELIEHQSI